MADSDREKGPNLAMHYWSSRIRALRAQRGMKQTAFAELLGVTQATVSRWESDLQSPTAAEQRRILATFPELRSEPRTALVLFVQDSLNCIALFNEALEPLALSASFLALHGYVGHGPSLTEARRSRASLAALMRQVSAEGGFFSGAFASLIHTAATREARVSDTRPYFHRTRYFPLLMPPDRPILILESVAISEAEYDLTGEMIEFFHHDGTKRRVFPTRGAEPAAP